MKEIDEFLNKNEINRQYTELTQMFHDDRNLVEVVMLLIQNYKRSGNPISFHIPFISIQNIRRLHRSHALQIRLQFNTRSHHIIKLK